MTELEKARLEYKSKGLLQLRHTVEEMARRGEEEMYEQRIYLKEVMDARFWVDFI